MTNPSPSERRVSAEPVEPTPQFELAAQIAPAPQFEPAPILEPAVPTSKGSLRAKTPWFSLVGIVLLVLLTLGNAAANMVPFHVPTAAELQQQEQREIADAHRARLDALLAEGDQCRPHVAHEIVKGLVYVGRSAREYAADYRQRCGDDPLVERWGNAPRPRTVRLPKT